MKNKRFFHSFLMLLAALVCLGGFSVTAYAQGSDIPTDDSGVVVETEPQPLTPEGNMTLVDDISGEASEDKQFIVVQSKGGNYFYIIIDNAAEGENTVHFLNQVDEADLLALLEDGQTVPVTCTCTEKCTAGHVNTNCPVCKTDMTNCMGKEAQTTEPEPTAPPDETEQQKPGSLGGILAVLLVLAIGCGVGIWYFKFRKPKASGKGGGDLDEFDFDEDDEDGADEFERESDVPNLFDEEDDE